MSMWSLVKKTLKNVDAIVCKRLCLRILSTAGWAIQKKDIVTKSRLGKGEFGGE